MASEYTFDRNLESSAMTNFAFNLSRDSVQLKFDEALAVMKYLDPSHRRGLKCLSRAFREAHDHVTPVKSTLSNLPKLVSLEKDKQTVTGCGFKHLELSNVLKNVFPHFWVPREDTVDLSSFENLITLRLSNFPASEVPETHWRRSDEFISFILSSSVSKLLLVRSFRSDDIVLEDKEKTKIVFGSKTYRERAEYCIVNARHYEKEDCSVRRMVKIPYIAQNGLRDCRVQTSDDNKYWNDAPLLSNEETIIALEFGRHIIPFRATPIDVSFDEFICLVTSYLEESIFVAKRMVLVKFFFNSIEALHRNVDSVFKYVRTDTLIICMNAVRVNLSFLFSTHACAVRLKCLCLVFKCSNAIGGIDSFESAFVNMKDCHNSSIEEVSLKIVYDVDLCNSDTFTREELSTTLNAIFLACGNLKVFHLCFIGPTLNQIFDQLKVEKLSADINVSLDVLCVEYSSVNKKTSKGETDCLKKLVNFLSPKSIIMIRYGIGYAELSTSERADYLTEEQSLSVLYSLNFCCNRECYDVTSIPAVIEGLSKARSLPPISAQFVNYQEFPLHGNAFRRIECAGSKVGKVSYYAVPFCTRYVR